MGRVSGRVFTYTSPMLFAVLSCAFSSSAFANLHLPVVNFETATREAISWHPSIAEAAAYLRQQEQQVDVAEAGYYPQVTGGLGTGYDSTSTERWRPRANLGVNQRIWDFGKLSNQIAAEQAGVRANRAQVLISVDVIARDTALTLVEVRRGLGLLDAAKEQLASVTSLSNLVEARYTRGASTRSDALQAKSRIDAAQSTILQIEAELRRWQSNLAFMLNREDTPEVSDDAPPAFTGACAARELNWMEVPAAMQAEAQRDRAMAELRRSRAERYPTVSLGAGVGTEVGNPFGSGRTDYNVGLNVSTNLFDGGATGARARSADFALDAAEAAVENAQLEVSRQLSESGKQIGLFETRLLALNDRQTKMQETRALYRLQYLEMGTRTLVDLLNAEQELSQVRFDAVNSKYDLRRLAIGCLYTAGELRRAFQLEGMRVEGVSL